MDGSSPMPDVVTLAPGVVVHLVDVLVALARMGDASVHMVCTSIPYWGLRDYGVAPTEWPEVTYRPAWDLPAITVPAMTCALGLEPDLVSFVGHIVLVFRALARVMRADGCCWMNAGDSYSTGTNARRKASTTPADGRDGRQPHKPAGWTNRCQSERRTPDGLAPKNLLMQPHRVALALQGDGWIVRNDDVWEKASPMPESVTDRTTRAHELIFQLTRSTSYFYDTVAIMERSVSRGSGNAARVYGSSRGRTGDHRAVGVPWQGGTRNPRSVWRLSSEPFAGAHFATFPTAIPRRCILAGTSEVGCCPTCGAPWRRLTEKAKVGPVWNQRGPRTGQHLVGDVDKGRGKFAERFCVETVTTGWTLPCACPLARPVPCVVLDLFAGSGTTLAVAYELGRHAVGIDAQPAYLPLMRQRIADAIERAAMPVKRAPRPVAPAQRDLPLGGGR